MLRDLIRMWKKIDLLRQALEDFLSMIDAVETTFRTATDAVFGASKLNDARGTVYETDISVNQTERDIRKYLVEHLAVNPRGDAPACLILMSAAKDMERAGDFSKNILEVAGMAHEPLTQSKYADELRTMTDRVLASFTKTKRAFAEGDRTTGHEVIIEETQIAKVADAMVEKIADDETLSVNQAVCLAVLAFRYLKRALNAHLGNVASSVVMPLHKIDYFDEKWHKKEQQTDQGQP